MKSITFACTISCLLVFSDLQACIWDRDTLAAEQARFPEVSSLITGMFPRHSKEYYEWRKKTCEEQLAKTPDKIPLYDDLAVAMHKLGDHKGAIQVMLAKEKIKPDLYETRSNLGTFYIYEGNLDEAHKWISLALAINANAHFGREKYQLWLIEWLQQKKMPGQAKEGDPTLRPPEVVTGFARFVAQKANPWMKESEIELRDVQRSQALDGVEGMMRFADHDNPVLLEALGDLLLAGALDKNAAQLAALSYLHASRKVTDDAEKERLLKMMADAGSLTMGFKTTTMETLLDSGLARGKSYADGIRDDEVRWISGGADPDAEYTKKYLSK